MTTSSDFQRFSFAPNPPLTEPIRPVYHIVITENEGGLITAQCAEIPAAITQGKNREEAIQRSVEAIVSVKEASGIRDGEFVVLPTEF